MSFDSFTNSWFFKAKDHLSKTWWQKYQKRAKEFKFASFSIIDINQIRAMSEIQAEEDRSIFDAINNLSNNNR